jgi:hypothetical protein
MVLVSEDDGLRFLPSVFHVADLTIRFGWPPKAARRHLYHWKVHRQVIGLGGQSGIFANLTADQYPDWELALRMIMPTAVVIGIEILRRAGWTTQIPYVPTVAVNATQRVCQVDHFNIEALPPEWYNLMARGFKAGEAGALPHLAPAWALADLIKREGWCDCGLGPDDIYWDIVTEQDRQDWLAACSTLQLGLMVMNPDSPQD